jgi:hypothetical protein
MALKKGVQNSAGYLRFVGATQRVSSFYQNSSKILEDRVKDKLYRWMKGFVLRTLLHGASLLLG